MSVQRRHYRQGDHEAVATIFTRAIHELARADYSVEQLHQWAPAPPDVERWRTRCELKRPFLAVDGDVVAGFLELDPDGHIDCAYVNPDFARRGVMSMLMDHAEHVCRALGRERLYAEVSITARPFFAQRGFVLLNENEVALGDLVLSNFSMEKRLSPSPHRRRQTKVGD